MAKIIRSKMPVLGLALIIIAVPFSAFAGACFAHPIFIQDIEINSCAIMSTKIAGDVSSSIAPPSTVAKRYPGLILKGQVKAIRQIDQDEPGRSKFFVHPWIKVDEAKTFFYRNQSIFRSCAAFKPSRRIKLARYANCECDTGPSPDGYCALEVEEISDVPKEYLKYAK